MSTNYWDALEQILPEEQREQIAKKLTQLIRIGWGSVDVTARDHHLLDVRLTEIEPMRRPENHKIYDVHHTCKRATIDDVTGQCLVCGKDWRNTSGPEK